MTSSPSLLSLSELLFSDMKSCGVLDDVISDDAVDDDDEDNDVIDISLPAALQSSPQRFFHAVQMALYVFEREINEQKKYFPASFLR